MQRQRVGGGNSTTLRHLKADHAYEGTSHDRKAAGKRTAEGGASWSSVK